jgi:O-antigen/teichoic acid export membrane protein
MNVSTNRRNVAGRILTIAGTSIVAAGVAFVVNIISARVLGPEYRGHVATVLQLAYLVAPLVGFGADRALLRKNDERSSDVYALPSALAVTAMGAITGIAIGLIYGPWAMLAVPTALVTVAFSFYRSVAIESGLVRSYIAAFLLYQVSILLGSILLLFLQIDSWQWWAIVYIVPGFIPAAYSLRRVLRESALRRAGLVGSLRSNLQLLLASFSRLITTRLNRVVLPVIAGPHSLGLFIVVATATEPLYWLAQSLADHQTSASSGQNYSRSLLSKTLGKSLLLFISLAAVGGVILYLLLVPMFGTEYSEALELVLPLTAASVVLATYRQISGLLLATATPDIVGRVEGIAALVAVFVYPVSIYLWGAQGAAWGSIVVYLVGVIVGIAQYPFAKQQESKHAKRKTS